MRTEYARRSAIESYHKLLKSAGMNAEGWQQEAGAAFLRRLCVASMACLTVWHLQRDESGAAAKLGMKRTTLQSKMQKLSITRPQ